ncbi:MAG: hypothetical protein AAB517_02645 [Patescibacteria group bacterium]
MPHKTNNKPPPEVMTWARASPVLILCVIFDALRFFFNMFWFFGPALAALYCTVKVSDAIGSLGGIVAGACTAGAATAGGLAFGAIEMFGVIMAMAVGLIGWLTVFLIQLINNAGIFKENFAMIIRILLGLLLSEIPIINALPSLTILNATMFHIQIKKGKEELKKWKKENAEAQAEERNRQNAQLMQAQAMQQQAANDATYNQIQAANDEKYNGEEIPEEVRKAA